MTLSTKKNPGEGLAGVPGEVAGVLGEVAGVRLREGEGAVRAREEIKAGNYR